MQRPPTLIFVYLSKWCIAAHWMCVWTGLQSQGKFYSNGKEALTFSGGETSSTALLIGSLIIASLMNTKFAQRTHRHVDIPPEFYFFQLITHILSFIFWILAMSLTLFRIEQMGQRDSIEVESTTNWSFFTILDEINEVHDSDEGWKGLVSFLFVIFFFILPLILFILELYNIIRGPVSQEFRNWLVLLRPWYHLDVLFLSLISCSTEGYFDYQIEENFPACGVIFECDGINFEWKAGIWCLLVHVFFYYIDIVDIETMVNIARMRWNYHTMNFDDITKIEEEHVDEEEEDVSGPTFY